MRIRGVELGAGTLLWQQRLHLDGELTLLDSEDLALHRPLAYRPRWSLQLGPSLHMGPVSGRLDYRYASRLQRVAQHELGVRVQLEAAGLQWTVGVNNLLNYNYTQLERNLGKTRNAIVAVNGVF